MDERLGRSEPGFRSKDMAAYGEPQYGDAPKGIEVAELIVVFGVFLVLEKVGQIKQALERRTPGKKGLRAKLPPESF